MFSLYAGKTPDLGTMFHWVLLSCSGISLYKQELRSNLPLLPVGGRAMGEEGRGGEGSWAGSAKRRVYEGSGTIPVPMARLSPTKRLVFSLILLAILWLVGEVICFVGLWYVKRVKDVEDQAPPEDGLSS